MTTSASGPTTPEERDGDVVALRLPFGNPPFATREFALDVEYALRAYALESEL